MPDIRTRMCGLHHLLTGETVRTSRYAHPPRHLWGDIGLLEERPRTPRLSLPARLLRWGGLRR